MLNALIWVHVLLFVFWLGADTGVYISHLYVVRRELSPESRLVALRIMRQCDLWPRVTQAMFLASGTALIAADKYGGQFRGWKLWGAVALSAAWLAVTIWLYVEGGRERQVSWYKRVFWGDLGFRAVLAVGLASVGLYTVIAHDPFGVTTNPKWLGAKVVLYGLAILMGVIIEICLVGFGPAFGALMTHGSSEEIEGKIRSSLVRARPYVYSLWLFVAAAAYLGVARPGAHVSG